MDHLIQDAKAEKRQYLMEELIKSGVYKKNNKHLYEWTLSDLEKEFNDLNPISAHQRVARKTIIRDIQG